MFGNGIQSIDHKWLPWKWTEIWNNIGRSKRRTRVSLRVAKCTWRSQWSNSRSW